MRDIKNIENVNKAFGIEPKRAQMCKKHRDTQVEFYCEVENIFYCRRCAKEHTGHDDKCVSEIANDV